MVNQATRSTFKRALEWSRFKLVYNRITLTKFTTTYFFIALIYCIVLAALQGIAYADNAAARNIVSSVIGPVNMTGLVVDVQNQLALCDGLPNVATTKCMAITRSTQEVKNAAKSRRDEMFEWTKRVEIVARGKHHRLDKDEPEALRDSDGNLTGVDYDGVVLSVPCASSLHWLNDTLRDAIREDLTILVFHFWLFVLAVVTILNESLPHLVTGLTGHALVTAWAAFRVANSRSVQQMYDVLIVQGTCASNNGPGQDILGNWWDMRKGHEIPILVLNAASLILVGLLSLKLYKVYARQSFERVGASASTSQVHILYKLVLILSSLLQGAGFFVLASTIMWIDKASSGNISRLSDHLNLYRAALIVMIVLVIPWLVLGWRSVRREQRRLFWAFIAISILFLVLSSLSFGSHLFRFIFSMWPLFASMAITSYILIVAITIMSIICRSRFGMGLKEFLKQSETAEGADFAPVYIASFPSSPDDDEKGKMDFSDSTFRSADLALPARPIAAHQDSSPRSTYAGGGDQSQNNRRSLYVEKSFYDYNSAEDMVESDPSPIGRSASKRSLRTSVFNDPARDTVKLSTTPPVAREQALARVEEESFPMSLPASQVKRFPPRKGSLKKVVIGLPSNPRKGGVPMPRGEGNYF